MKYKCQNRHCRKWILKPGRCATCAAMWAETCQRAQEAYAKVTNEQ